MTDHDRRMHALERKMRFARPTADGRLPEVTPELLALVVDPDAPMILVGRPRSERGRVRDAGAALKALAAAVRFVHP